MGYIPYIYDHAENKHIFYTYTYTYTHKLPNSLPNSQEGKEPGAVEKTRTNTTM